MPRLRGGDWLQDEVVDWKAAGIKLVRKRHFFTGTFVVPSVGRADPQHAAPQAVTP
jgi:hypothetical protein